MVGIKGHKLVSSIWRATLDQKQAATGGGVARDAAAREVRVRYEREPVLGHTFEFEEGFDGKTEKEFSQEIFIIGNCFS